ncbi:MAG TPA: universal stress protein, partial [Acidimicrobiales bacterium]
GHLVLGVDGSPGSLAAVRWAADLASRADLDLVAAWARTERDGEPPDPDAAGAATAPVEPTILVTEGNPRQALLSVAREQDADLLVVGPRGLGGLGGLRLGSVTNHLVHHTTVPLAVVPTAAATAAPPTATTAAAQATAEPVGHLVLGVDGSPGSLAAVRWAADLAPRLGVRVTAVLAQDPLLEWVPEHDDHGWRRHARRLVEGWVADIRAAEVPVDVDIDRDINPAAALTRASSRHPGSLVVVGGRRLSPVIRVRRGRVPLRILHDAAVPVAVVPATDDPGGPS